MTMNLLLKTEWVTNEDTVNERATQIRNLFFGAIPMGIFAQRRRVYAPEDGFS